MFRGVTGLLAKQTPPSSEESKHARGFQSLNVNNGHYFAAALTSFVVGAMQMILLKLGPDASSIEIGTFVGGGPLGIVACMWAHHRTLGKRHSCNVNCGADRP